MSHAVNDRIGLELARAIAAGLPDHPEWIDTARSNLARWSTQNAGAPGLLRCYDEWLDLLARPLPEIVTELLAPTDRGQRLRQNSPFAGVLAPDQVWAIKQRCRDGTIAA